MVGIICLVFLALTRDSGWILYFLAMLWETFRKGYVTVHMFSGQALIGAIILLALNPDVEVFSEAFHEPLLK